jgi:hypothetical protein
MLALLIVLAILALGEALAYRYGRDSRDGDDWLLHRGAEFEVRAR